MGILENYLQDSLVGPGCFGNINSVFRFLFSPLRYTSRLPNEVQTLRQAFSPCPSRYPKSKALCVELIHGKL